MEEKKNRISQIKQILTSKNFSLGFLIFLIIACIISLCSVSDHKPKTKLHFTSDDEPSKAISSQKPTEKIKRKSLLVNIGDATEVEVGTKDAKGNQIRVFKRPVLINDEKVIYVGSTNRLDSIQRVLDTETNLQDAIIEAAIKKIKPMEVIISEYSDEYVFKLGNSEIIRLNDEDAMANKVSKKELADAWKLNFDKLIAKYKNNVDISESSIEYHEILIIFAILVLLTILVELLKPQMYKIVRFIVVKFIQKTDKKILHLKKITENIEGKEYEIETETEEQFLYNEKMKKIEQIANYTNKILNIKIIFIEVATFLIFFIGVLYNLPETYPYVNEFVNHLLSLSISRTEIFFNWMLSKNTWNNIGQIFIILVHLLINLLIIELITLIVKNIIHLKFEEKKSKEKRFQTINKLISMACKIIVLILTVWSIIEVLNVNLTPLLAGAGIAGVVISIGGQNLIKDFLNGFFIIVENQFGIGDYVKINDISGTVEDITLRIIVLRELSGTVNIIPNGQILKVSVFTKEWARANLDIPVAYNTDVDRAIKLIQETANELHAEKPEQIIHKPIVLGVNKWTDNSIEIKVILDTHAGEQWSIERELRRRIKNVFDQNDIKMVNVGSYDN